METAKKENTNHKEKLIKRLWRKESERTREKIESDYPIDGSSFDESTTKGMENALSKKFINSEYFWQKVGYFAITSISISASIWGGWVLGTILFILMAAAVELIKLIAPVEAKVARVLASIFSFAIGLYGINMALQHENAAAGNQEQNEQFLITSIASIDSQLKNMGTSNLRPVSSDSGYSFDNRGYNALIKEIASKEGELERLKKERHTYWQRKPNKRNRRTGAWMLANPSKCTGTFCKTLNNKVSYLKGLKDQKVELEKQKVDQMKVQKLALKAQMDSAKMAQEREATRQNLIRTRNEYQQKLMNMNNNVQLEKPIMITMLLVITFLVFVEYAQAGFKESTDSMKAHRARINMMYDNYKEKVKTKEEKIRKEQEGVESRGGWFSKKPKVPPKKVVNQFEKKGKLTKEIAIEIKKVLDESKEGGKKYARSKCFVVFDKFGVGQTQTNFKNFKTMMNI